MLKGIFTKAATHECTLIVPLYSLHVRTLKDVLKASLCGRDLTKPKQLFIFYLLDGDVTINNAFE